MSARRPGWAPLAAGALPLAFLGVLFLYPVARLLLLSVEDGSLRAFERAAADALYLGVLLETLKLSLIVAAICLVLAYPAAYFLATASRGWAALGFACLLLPFWSSILVRTYAWTIVLGRNGLVNRLLLETGLIAEPLALLNNEAGVVVGMVHVLLPYMVFPIYSAMLRVDRDLLRAAEGLGASGWSVFRRVFLPLTLPGIVAGTALVFILSLGFYITPALLGGGKVVMIAVLIEQQVRQFLEWGFAAALSILLLVSAVLVYFGLSRLGRGAAP